MGKCWLMDIKLGQKVLRFCCTVKWQQRVIMYSVFISFEKPERILKIFTIKCWISVYPDGTLYNVNRYPASHGSS